MDRTHHCCTHSGTMEQRLKCLNVLLFKGLTTQGELYAVRKVFFQLSSMGINHFTQYKCTVNKSHFRWTDRITFLKEFFPSLNCINSACGGKAPTLFTFFHQYGSYNANLSMFNRYAKKFTSLTIFLQCENILKCIHHRNSVQTLWP